MTFNIIFVVNRYSIGLGGGLNLYLELLGLPAGRTSPGPIKEDSLEDNLDAEQS
jgi:hypothetical protein